MNDVVDVFLNTPTCLLCGKMIKKGEIYCKECQDYLKSLRGSNANL